MKRLTFTMICMLFVSVLTAQQVTLLHTFDQRTLTGSSGYFNYHSNDYYYANTTDSYLYVDAGVNEKGYYSYELDNASYTYKYTTYNNDFSINTSKTYTIPQIENYELSWVYLYSTLFDDDESTTEMLVQYEHKDGYSSGNIRTKYVLYTEHGDLIFDFGTAENIYIDSWLHYLDGEFRLWVEYRYSCSEEEREQTGKYSYYIYKIFKIDKKTLTGLQQIPAEMLPYPNPAKSNINIPLNNDGMLNIYDLNGRRIESIPVSGNNVNLNVSGYPSGQYIYEQNGFTNQFIVQ